MTLDHETILDITLSTICSRNQYTTDPQPVIDELRRTAGVRTDVLARVAGTWAGYYGSEHTAPLANALRGLSGAEGWVLLGEKRRGISNHRETLGR